MKEIRWKFLIGNFIILFDIKVIIIYTHIVVLTHIPWCVYGYRDIYYYFILNDIATIHLIYMQTYTHQHQQQHTHVS